MPARRDVRSLVALGLAALLLAYGAGAELSSQRATSSMVVAADQFLQGLSPDERQQAAFALDAEERLRWNFIPTEMFPRKGLPIKAMSEPQRKLAHALLQAGLSQRGYKTATAVIEHESILRALENPARFARDSELYFFSVFGTPSADAAWGWRVEGHHMSLHFTMVKGRTTVSTPTFFGANPARVPSGPHEGLRILAAEEDSARALLELLDEAQRKTAIVAATAPTDILTMTTLDLKPLDPAGLAAGAMTPPQREALMAIIDTYASQMESGIAAQRMAALKQAGVDKIGFAWAGETERGKKHYYRVQGPTFLIEYDNTQNDGNHIHSVWRDFTGDFGRDLIREHKVAVRH